MEHDRLDRLVKVTTSGRRGAQAAGRRRQPGRRWTRKGNQTCYEHDAANCVKAEVYADGSRLAWDWDLAEPAGATRPCAFVTGFEHDALDRLVRLTYTG